MMSQLRFKNSIFKANSLLTVMEVLASVLLTSHSHALPQKVLFPGQSITLPNSSGLPLWMEKNRNEKIIGSPVRKYSSQMPGENVLFSGRTGQRLQVITPATQALFSAFQKIIDQTPGLKIRLSQGAILVSGNLYNFKEWLALVDAAKEIPGDWHNQTLTSIEIERRIQNYILRSQRQAGLYPYLPKSGFSFISIPDTTLKESYQSILRPLGLSTKVDSNTLRLSPMIKIEMVVAEVKRSFTQGLGLNFPKQLSASIIPGESTNIEALVFGAKALEDTGQGKTLANPTLVTRSGKDAEFHAGGEFPIRIMNFKTQDVVWKQYGVRLKVKPLVDNLGNMSLNIDTEVSSLDEAHTVDGVPGLLTNRISTSLDLQSSKLVALSGLIKNESGLSSQNYAGLSQIPLLGRLFQSEDFRENRSELIIFVRPTVLTESGGSR